MARFNFTQNTDSFGANTAGADVYSAQLYTTLVGTQANTLQTGDSAVDHGGRDVLNATVTDTSNAPHAGTAGTFIRPVLKGIETLNFTAVGASGGVEVDLSRSSGVSTISDGSSNIFLQFDNAGATANYKFHDVSNATGDEGLTVNGLTTHTINVAVSNIAAGSGVPTLTFDPTDELTKATFKLVNADTKLVYDADATAFQAFGGAAATNRVDLSGATTHAVTISGAGHVEIVDSPVSLAPAVAQFDQFNAWTNTGGVKLDNDISVSTKFGGSQGDDDLQNLTLTGANAVANLGKGDNTVHGTITGDGSGTFSVIGLAGVDDITAISVAVDGAATISLGGGNDDIGSLTSGAAATSLQLGDGNDVAGDISVTHGAATIDAGAGDDAVTIVGLDNTQTNSVTMGDGDDTLDVSAAAGLVLENNPSAVSPTPVTSLDGGAGTNTLKITLDSGFAPTSPDVSHIANFQTVDLLDSAGTFDAAAFAGATTFNMMHANPADVSGAAFTFTDVGLGEVFNVDEGFRFLNGTDEGSQHTSTLDLTAVGTNATTIGLGNDGTESSPEGNTVKVAATVHGFATVNVESHGDDTGGAGSSDFNVLSLTDGSASQVLTKVDVSGNEDLTLNFHSTNASQVTLDASGMGATGSIDFTESTFGAGGVHEIGSAGSDQFFGSNAADIFDLGGGSDQDFVLFSGQAQSVLGIGTFDTVNGFGSGFDLGDATKGDKLVFDSSFGTSTGTTETVNGHDYHAFETAYDAGGAPTGQLVFLGNAADFGDAQAAISSADGVSHPGTHSAVFDAGDHVLYIDTNGDGALNSSDFELALSNVAQLHATDMFVA